MVGPQAPWLVRKKDLKPLLQIGQCPRGCAIDYRPAPAPANIDIYRSTRIKTTLISGRNLPDISTVVGRAVTPSTREGVASHGWHLQKCRLAGTIPSRLWIRRVGRLPFMPSRIQGRAPARIRLKLFSANPQHVDAQAVTII